MSVLGLVCGVPPSGALMLWEPCRLPFPHSHRSGFSGGGCVKTQVPVPTQGQTCSLLTQRAKERAVGVKRNGFLILPSFIYLKHIPFFWKHLRGLTESMTQERSIVNATRNGLLGQSRVFAFKCQKWAWRSGMKTYQLPLGGPVTTGHPLSSLLSTAL